MTRFSVVGWVLGSVMALGGCNTKPPTQASGGCGPNEELHNGSCLPAEAVRGDAPRETPRATATETTPTSSGPTTAYDKDEVEALLRRSAKSVKEHCGAATNETGKPTGPWGTTKVMVKIGSRGHSKETVIPPPYDGKPTGICAVQAFANLTYTPFPGADVTIEWEVEIPEPKR